MKKKLFISQALYSTVDCKISLVNNISKNLRRKLPNKVSRRMPEMQKLLFIFHFPFSGCDC